MTIANTFVKSASGSATATTAAVDTTGSTLLVLVAVVDSATPPTVSDSKSNSWTAKTIRSTYAHLHTYYCASPTVGSGHTFTVSQSGNVALMVDGWSGTGASSYDGEVGDALIGSYFAASQGSAPITPSENNCVVITHIQGIKPTNATVSSQNGFTLLEYLISSGDNNHGIAGVYKVQTTAVEQNGTVCNWPSEGGSPGIETLVFKTGSGGGGGGSPSGRNLLLKVG